MATVTKIYGGHDAGPARLLAAACRCVWCDAHPDAGALLSAGSNLLFAWLAGHGHATALIAVVSTDNSGQGRGVGRVCCLPFQLTNMELSGYCAVRAVLVDDAAAKFVAGFSRVIT